MSLPARLWRAAFTYEAWNFGLATVDVGELLRTGRLGPVRWADLGPLFGLRADPVLWDSGEGTLRVLYEDLNHYRGYADIRSVAVDRIDGGRARVELAPPFHVSYPLIVAHAGRAWCTLESAIDRGVDLYEWNAAAKRWSAPLRILRDLPVLDPTLLEWQGSWYLFGTRLDGDGEHELHLWIADAPQGPWLPHPASPVRSPDGTARCAGAFFVHEGVLYRPSQVAKGGYGAALSIKRVERLDPKAFVEHEQQRLLPDAASPWPEGLHTLSIAGTLAVIDGKKRLTHPLAWLSKILWRLRGAHPARLKIAS